MVEEKLFGVLKDGQEVRNYILKNENGTVVELSEYGASVISVKTHDRFGKLADIVLGFDKLSDYENQKGTYMGATVGRFANRIHGGKFNLNGKTYSIYCNDGKNSLHGGRVGFDRRLWKGILLNDGVCFTYESPDGEENYPGKLKVCVTYTLDNHNALKIEYSAVSDKDTVLNLTNHSYFNLKGHDKGRADEMLLRINADFFTPVSRELIPTGEILSVHETPMDFRDFKRIKSRIEDDFTQLKNGSGYDHNWVLKKECQNSLTLAAELCDETCGRLLRVYTTMPGIQFYSGNFLDGSTFGKGGASYERRGGVCLETQYFPNSTEHAHFPSPILRAGDEYRHNTIFEFSVID